MAAAKILSSRVAALCTTLGILLVFTLQWSTVSGHYCQVWFALLFLYFLVKPPVAQSCPPAKPGALNVHIVSHTHLDTGWTSTYDQYYNRCKWQLMMLLSPSSSPPPSLTLQTYLLSTTRWWRVSVRMAVESSSPWRRRTSLAGTRVSPKWCSNWCINSSKQVRLSFMSLPPSAGTVSGVKSNVFKLNASQSCRYLWNWRLIE